MTDVNAGSPQERSDGALLPPVAPRVVRGRAMSGAESADSPVQGISLRRVASRHGRGAVRGEGHTSQSATPDHEVAPRGSPTADSSSSDACAGVDFEVGEEAVMATPASDCDVRHPSPVHIRHYSADGDALEARGASVRRGSALTHTPRSVSFVTPGASTRPSTSRRTRRTSSFEGQPGAGGHGRTAASPSSVQANEPHAPRQSHLVRSRVRGRGLSVGGVAGPVALAGVDDRAHIRGGLFQLIFSTFGVVRCRLRAGTPLCQQPHTPACPQITCAVMFVMWLTLRTFAVPLFWAVLCSIPMRYAKRRIIDLCVALAVVREPLVVTLRVYVALTRWCVGCDGVLRFRSPGVLMRISMPHRVAARHQVPHSTPGTSASGAPLCTCGVSSLHGWRC